MSDRLSFFEAHNQACALVGRYINAWAFLETDIAWSIHRIYRIEYASGAILTGNMGLGAKIAALRSAISHRSIEKMTPEWRDEADRVFNKISELVQYRNLAVHNYFDATEEGDVRFFKLAVKRGFAEQELVWTKAEIEDKCERLHELSYCVVHLTSELRHDGSSYLEPRQPSEMLSLQTPLYLEESSSSPLP